MRPADRVNGDQHQVAAEGLQPASSMSTSLAAVAQAVVGLQQTAGNRAAAQLLRVQREPPHPEPPHPELAPPTAASRFVAPNDEARLRREAPHRELALREMIAVMASVRYDAATPADRRQQSQAIVIEIDERLARLDAGGAPATRAAAAELARTRHQLTTLRSQLTTPPLPARRSRHRAPAPARGPATTTAAVAPQATRDLNRDSSIEYFRLWAGTIPVNDLERKAGQMTSTMPQWQRTMLTNYLGRAYQSAHGSWRSPYQLLQILDAAARGRRLTPEEGRAWTELSPSEALGRLQAMRPTMPRWAWLEVARHTDLRTTLTDAELAEDTSRDQSDPRTAAWRLVLSNWASGSTTAWLGQGLSREQMATPLRTVVCNQLAEAAQAARGVDLPGGIAGDANRYASWAAQHRGSLAAMEAGMMSAAAPPAHFGRVRDARDLPEGAGLFFLAGTWRETRPPSWTAVTAVGDRYPNPYDPGTPLTPDQRRRWFEARQQFSDGDDDGTWRYHVPHGRLVRRSRLDDPNTSQWMAWAHEATVLRIEGPWALVLETTDAASGGDQRVAFAGVTRRLVTSLRGPHVYVGYTDARRSGPARASSSASTSPR